MAAVRITMFTDPACPFAFSAEPARQRLRWHYGDAIEWSVRMIVLTREQGHAQALAQGAPTLQRRYGMPIDPRPRAAPASSEPASLAVVAARMHAPGREQPLLRALRVRAMAGGLMDDPALIAASARDAGLDPARLDAWVGQANVAEALEADIAAARNPSAAAHALDHKLGGPRSQRRYTAPTYAFSRADGSGAVFAPGFQPIETYEMAVANLEPTLARREPPRDAAQLLEWASEPLASAEVGSVMGLELGAARLELERAGAIEHPSGAESFWTVA